MTDRSKQKRVSRARRHHRIRSRVIGSSAQPRLSVHRTHKHLFVQLIDDGKGATLVSAHDKELKGSNASAQHKVDVAKDLGMLVAKKAKEHSIERVVFDRGGYRYAGRIRAVADGAREGGLQF